MLASLGLNDADETAYRLLLRQPHLSAAELAAGVRTSLADVRVVVSRLEELGFVSRLSGSPERLVATNPEVAVNALISQRTEQFVGARAIARQLSEQFPGALRTPP